MLLAEVFAGSQGEFGPTALPLATGPQVFVRAIDTAGNISGERGTRDGEWVASAQTADLYPAVEVALAAASDVELEPASLGNPVSLAALASAEGDRSGSVSTTGRRTWRQRSHGQANLLRAAAAVAYDSRRSLTRVFGGRSAVGYALQDLWSWNGHDWSAEVQQGESPGPRYGPGMVYDVRRDRLVLFGGAVGLESIDNGQTLDELWEFDGSAWTEIPTSGDWPPARARHAMAYDVDRGVTVLFGGCSDGINCTTTQLADTWEWDGSTWQQVHDGITGEFPPARSAAAMVYAPIVGGCVLTGGCANDATQSLVGLCQQQQGDTWIWDGTAWQAGVATSWRAYHNLVFNNQDQTVMAIGGCRSSPAGDDCENQLSLYPQTWDGGDSWSIYTSAGNSPLRNFDGIVTYDAARDELVIALGYYGSGSQLRTTAISRSSTDTRVVHDATRPGPTARQGMRAAYDSAVLDGGTPQIVFYGGQLTTGSAEAPNDINEFSDELWRLADDQWAVPETAGTPRARASVAVDESRRRLVIAGGHDHASPLGDTIEADLTSTHPNGWVACDETGLDTMAGACWPGWANHLLWSAPAIYDPLATPNPVVRVFGGFNYNPSPSATAVTARRDADDWDGTDWSDADNLPLVESSPSLIDKRAAFGVAYDSLRDVVVLYGGLLDNGRGVRDPYDPAQDTWEWSRATGEWTLVCDGDAGCPCPGKRHYFGLVYDSVRARVVLFGGVANNTRANDVWEWDGSAWNRMDLIGASPAGRADAAVAYDPGRERMVVFGGLTNASVLEDDLWQLELGNTSSPMATVDVDWGRSGVSLGDVTSVELEVGAGARGYTTDTELVVDADVVGDAVDGVRVSGWSWRLGRWLDLQQSSASPSAPATTVVPSDGADWADAYCDPTTNEFRFAIRPMAGPGNGPAPAEVLVDYAVFRARYRLP
jgi:hypothetical protein